MRHGSLADTSELQDANIHIWYSMQMNRTHSITVIHFAVKTNIINTPTPTHIYVLYRIFLILNLTVVIVLKLVNTNYFYIWVGLIFLSLHSVEQLTKEFPLLQLCISPQQVN